MTSPTASSLIRNISDTARWVAMYRAIETDRPDRVFTDPFARKLAGERGRDITNAMRRSNRDTWPFVVRTLLFDQFIMREIGAGCDLVLNLAAGLDARPYRMPLPPSLTWIEVDLPGIIDEKEAILRDDTPVCALERVRLDLSDVPARRKLFAACGERARRVLVVSEGLLIYLSSDEVASLARDLAAPSSFARWIFEIISPALLRMMAPTVGKTVADAGAPFKFAPPDGELFFVPHGWRPVEVKSGFRTAGEIGRLSWFLNLMSKLPERPAPRPRRPWTGTCLMERIPAGS